MDVDVNRVVAQLSQAAKYRDLCEPTLRRMAAWAAARSASTTDAVKRAKRKLHQVYAAYLEGWDATAAERLMGQVEAKEAPADIARDVARRIMANHVSCRERFGALDHLYHDIFAITGLPTSVLDLGCGLHPLAIPWMGLPADVRYTAWDVDQRLTGVVGRFLAWIGQAGEVQAADLLVSLPQQPVDLVFLLKMLPCLEQQQPGVSRELVRHLPGRWLVISFPAQSIGGRLKGMVQHYDQAMRDTLDECGYAAQCLHTPTETFYIVNKA